MAVGRKHVGRHVTRIEPKALAERLWRTARVERPVAAMLEWPFTIPTFGRVFLLNRDELFPTKNVSSGGMSMLLRAPGLPYLSHRFKRTFPTTKQPHPLGVVMTEAARRAAGANEVIRRMQEQLGNSIRDEAFLATLNVVQANPDVKALVTGAGPIDRPRLRQSLKDYSGVNFDPAKQHVLSILQMAMSGRVQKALRPMLTNINLMLDAMDTEVMRLQLAGWTAWHIQPALRVRGVEEATFRKMILELAATGYLRQHGPIFIWCARCAQYGIAGTLRSIVPPDALPPLCSVCGRVGMAMGIFIPCPALFDAIRSQDGLLGAAIGWYLTKHKIPFEYSVPVKDEECDFIAQRRGAVLIECKMNAVLAKESSLRWTLLENRGQLRDHIKLAKQNQISVRAAVCVVNLRRRQLGPILRQLKPEPAPEFREVGAKLISYEDFPNWARYHVLGR